MLYDEKGKWYHSKLNKTGFAALCKVEALDTLEEMWNGTIEKAKNIKVNYHTNGTIYDTELLELWKHFKRVDLFLSFDGIDRINKYVRYPSLHDTVVNNLKKYKKGFDESLSTDHCTHSFFGVSKTYADYLAQEFGKNFNLKSLLGLFFPKTSTKSRTDLLSSH